jgi:hypothetical protein
MSSFLIRFDRVREELLFNITSSSFQLFQVTIKFDEMMMIMKGKSNIEGQQFYEYQHH